MNIKAKGFYIMRKHDVSIHSYEQNKTAQNGNGQSNHVSPMRFYDLFDSRIKISGFAFDNEKILCRLPEKLLGLFSDEIVERSYCTSGGMLHFDTDSGRIVVKVSLHHAFSRPFMTLMACRGLDFYIGQGSKMEYFATAMPGDLDMNMELHYESALPAVRKELHHWSVYLPIFAGIESLSIGIDADATLSVPESLPKKRIVFYGSSITQGIAATRPGNTYVNQVGRKLDAEAINLGFAGNARGEPEIAEVIAKIRMDAFVMDYDHNSPSCSHLGKTHERFFQIIRKQNPFLPILILTKPDFDTDMDDSAARRKIIHRTYENAVHAGDENVYFIDGESLYGRSDRDCCTADNCHPNDLGFYRMAEKISHVLKKIL